MYLGLGYYLNNTMMNLPQTISVNHFYCAETFGEKIKSRP
jgi:hypothetical protein